MANVDIRDLVMGTLVLGAVVMNSAAHSQHAIRMAPDWPTVRELLERSVQNGTACADDPTVCIQLMMAGP